VLVVYEVIERLEPEARYGCPPPLSTAVDTKNPIALHEGLDWRLMLPFGHVLRTRVLPQWSPDGKTIAFCGQMPNAAWKVYIVPGDGTRRPVEALSRDNCLMAQWSSDGNSLSVWRGGRRKKACPRLWDADRSESSLRPATMGHKAAIPGSPAQFDAAAHVREVSKAATLGGPGTLGGTEYPARFRPKARGQAISGLKRQSIAAQGAPT
jgi:hypothetical protein